MVDEVGVLTPFTTRSGGDWPSGELVAEGFKALTTSLIALALLVCLTRDLIGLAHRGSGVGRLKKGRSENYTEADLRAFPFHLDPIE
jgi:hypothetical protein